MFPCLELFLSEDEEVNETVMSVRILRKNLRNRSNILDLPDEIFMKNFRLTKQAFVTVLHFLDLPDGIRSTHIPPILQLAATLNLLGGGAYQRQVGADWTAPMGQSTVAEVTAKVITEMERKLCPRMIKFSPSETTKMYFTEKYKIPGVIGCIDGTHINLIRPRENEHMFFNRKGKHSVNAMIICDEKKKIMAVNGMYGGCAHDSFVWRQSKEREALQQGHIVGNSFWLLGDSGYPLEPFLITPYRNAETNSPEARFNLVHSQARSIVERCIGILKVRWRILLEERKCRYAPERVVQIINVCVALHNICCDLNVPLDEGDIAQPPTNLTHQSNMPEDLQPSNREAARIRDALRNNLM